MATGAVLGVIGAAVGATALVWTWQISQQVSALPGEDIAARVAALEEGTGTSDALADALAERIAADDALAERLRGPAGAAVDVDAVAAQLVEQYGEALTGPAGAPGPAGADAVAPSAAQVAVAVLEIAGDALVGPPGPPGAGAALPAGAVIAWQSDACPEGWVPVGDIGGRFILGAGAGTGGTTYAVGRTGGGESHNHGVTVNLMTAATVAQDPAVTVPAVTAGHCRFGQRGRGVLVGHAALSGAAVLHPRRGVAA